MFVGSEGSLVSGRDRSFPRGNASWRHDSRWSLGLDRWTSVQVKAGVWHGFDTLLDTTAQTSISEFKEEDKEEERATDSFYEDKYLGSF